MEASDGDVVLRAHGLGGRRVRMHRSTLRAGEVVGIAGLAGSGRSELLRLIAGASRRHAGTATLDGDDFAPGGIGAAQRERVVLVPPERRSQALSPDSVERNLNATTIDRHARLRGPAEARAGACRAAVAGLPRPRCWPGPGGADAVGRQPAEGRAGQFLALEPRVLLLDEPTRGVDVATKSQIYGLIREQAAAGCAVIVVSSELPELIGLSDRIVVMHEGRIVGRFDRGEATEEQLPRRDEHDGRTGTAARGTERTDDMSAQNRARALRPLVGPLVLIGLVAFFGALYPTTFLSQQNLLINILDTVSFLVIVAAAQTIVMVVGDFDLSVGGLAALATSFTGAMLATTTLGGDLQDPAFVPLAIGIGLAVGLICGIANGVLVAYLGVLAFIATLGMSVVFTNLARFRVDGRPVYGLVEEGFVEIARGSTLGLSNKVWIAARYRRRDLVPARPHHARPQDVRGRRQRRGLALQRHRRQASAPHRLRALRRRRGCRRHPAGRDHRDRQHGRDAELDAAVDRGRLHRAWPCSEVAGRTCRAPSLGVILLRVIDNGLELHRHPRRAPERHLRGRHRDRRAAAGHRQASR